MTPTIRLAFECDADAVAGIYRPFCESTAVSFEYAAPSTEEIANRIRTITSHFPWLVLDDNGVVAGYAYASRHRERAAYSWSVDTAVYVGPSHRRRGVGRALYTTMFQLLRRQGYFKAYAGITLPNNASIGLHEAVGFKLMGIYQGVGYKHGAWHDVAWYQMALQSERLNPDPPVPVSALDESPGWAEAVSHGLRHYRPSAARQPDGAGTPDSLRDDVAAAGGSFGSVRPAITIRTERPEDASQVRNVNELAFGQAAEADLAQRLQQACTDSLSLVAEDDVVVGHILFTPAVVECAGRRIVGMGLAPMAVLPHRQRQGIGSQLVRRGLDILLERRCPFVIVVGHPEYYPRFGFEPASLRGLASQWEGMPDAAFMVLILDAHAMAGVSGVAQYREEFNDRVRLQQERVARP